MARLAATTFADFVVLVRALVAASEGVPPRVTRPMSTRGPTQIRLFRGGVRAGARPPLPPGGARLEPGRLTAAPAAARGNFRSDLALHVGVERIGRYLQVFYETDPLAPAASPALPALPKW